ncbi:MAG: VOC family protein [Deltaproteobacteria bacterium]|nr:VOC family protein [Deltaproteobacteria bacterium]
MRRRLLIGGVVLLAALLGSMAALRSTRPSPGGLATTGVLHVNINCSDFERSRLFYERLGFVVLMEVTPDGEGNVAAAVGFSPRYEVRGALMANANGFVIDLLEWKEPHDPAPPYERLNHIGLARLAFTTTDLDADVAKLKAAGAAFLSERPGAVPDPLGGTTRFISFRDPDGTVLELVEMGTAMSLIQRASSAVSRPPD